MMQTNVLIKIRKRNVMKKLEDLFFTEKERRTGKMRVFFFFFLLKKKTRHRPEIVTFVLCFLLSDTLLHSNVSVLVSRFFCRRVCVAFWNRGCGCHIY